MAHELKPLPYEFTALEPHMDARTVELHWGAHHRSYVTKLNAALEQFPDKSSVDLTSLLGQVAGTSAGVINNAGGHYNHCLYWQNMTSMGSANERPFGELMAKIEEKFGSYDEFKKQFSDIVVGTFGSGWAWLTVGSDGNVFVQGTRGHDNALMAGYAAETGIPILTCDVWEHAFYLKYQNRKQEYVENWWKLVNWDAVCNNYENYAKQGNPVPFN